LVGLGLALSAFLVIAICVVLANRSEDPVSLQPAPKQPKPTPPIATSLPSSETKPADQETHADPPEQPESAATTPATAATELLLNPGGEVPAANGIISHWLIVQGNWRAASKQPAAEGTFYFTPGQVGTAELMQDVNVARFADKIDRHVQNFRFAAQFAQFSAKTARPVPRGGGVLRRRPLENPR